MVMMGSSKHSLYTLLGVTPSATEAEITKAYRKLALAYHPDRNPDGADKFKALANAYAVLTDKEKRGVYDATGIVPGDGGSSNDPVSKEQRAAEVGQEVHTFFETYAGSDEEVQDVIKCYTKSKGNFRKMVEEQLLFDNGKEDEVRRLRQVVQKCLAAGKLQATELWEKTSTDKAVKKVERKMQEEREMAEEALKELGVDGKAPAGGQGGEAGSLIALQALMRQRQEQAHQSMLSHLEERYIKQPREQRGGSGAGKRGREEKHDSANTKKYKSKK